MRAIILQKPAREQGLNTQRAKVYAGTNRHLPVTPNGGDETNNGATCAASNDDTSPLLLTSAAIR